MGGGVPTNRNAVTETSFAVQLRQVLQGRVCVLGVGNRDRRDDGAGSVVAEHLAGRTAARVIDAGTVPENRLEQVARLQPDTVLILDACDFGGSPGDVRILDPMDLHSSGISTHSLSLQMAAGFLMARTQARLALLAIQPADIGAGPGLSAPVAGAVERVRKAFIAALKEHENEQQS